MLTAPAATTTAVTMLAAGVALLAWPATGRSITGLGRGGRDWRHVLRHVPGISPWRIRPRSVGVVLGVVVGSAVALVASWACAVAAGIAAVTAARLVRHARAAGRYRRGLSELAAALRRLARDLQAGTAPAVAAAHVVAESPPVVVGALAGLATGVSPGADLGGEFTEVRARLTVGWELSARHGVPLAAVVASVADDLADRSRSADARVAQVAGPAVSGYVLAALPVGGLLLGAGMGADPLSVLTGSTVGSVLLLVGTALCCGGLLWTDRIVRG